MIPPQWCLSLINHKIFQPHLTSITRKQTVKQRFHFNGAGLLLIAADFSATAGNEKPQLLNSNISHEWTMNRIFEELSNFHLTFDKLCFFHLSCLKLSPKLPKKSQLSWVLKWLLYPKASSSPPSSHKSLYQMQHGQVHCRNNFTLLVPISVLIYFMLLW